jgi:hypothetical protein
MDEKRFNLTISSKDSILDLKRKLEAESSVPANLQRLIFKGKLLEDNKLVKDYYIDDESAIHFIAKLNDSHESFSNNNNLNDFETENNNNPGVRVIRTGGSELFPNILGSINFLPIPNPTRHRDSIGKIKIFIVFLAFLNDSMTSVLQNNYTLSSLLCNKSFQKDFNAGSLTENNNKVEFPLDFIDFNNRTFTIGQWIDVKDTVNQWLEAEVIDKVKLCGPIRNYDKIKVHYLGWGEHWDEWIDSYSPRIMPFRYYTNERYGKRLCPTARIINSHRNDVVLKELKQLDYLLSESNSLLANKSNIATNNIRKNSNVISYNKKDSISNSFNNLNNNIENELLLVEDDLNNLANNNLHNNNDIYISNSGLKKNQLIEENNSNNNTRLNTSTINRVNNNNFQFSEETEVKTLSIIDLLSSMSK